MVAPAPRLLGRVQNVAENDIRSWRTSPTITSWTSASGSLDRPKEEPDPLLGSVEYASERRWHLGSSSLLTKPGVGVVSLTGTPAAGT